MTIQMREGAVPFVITYRKILEKPKLKRDRKFVGPRQILRNLALMALEFCEDLAYETKTEVISPGKSVSVHWAIDVEDPWDAQPGREVNLIAYRMLDDMPPCGAHFEIITPVKTPRRSQHTDTAAGQRWVRPADEAYDQRDVEPLENEDIVILPDEDKPDAAPKPQ